MPGKPERTNPLTPDINQTLTAKIGEFHAEVFDGEGIRYFTEEGYDDFYMGKGSTYPDLFGTVGICVCTCVAVASRKKKLLTAHSVWDCRRRLMSA